MVKEIIQILLDDSTLPCYFNEKSEQVRGKSHLLF